MEFLKTSHILGVPADIFAIYLTTIIFALVLNKLFAANRPGRRLLIAGGISFLVAALEAPWYIERVWGLKGNIFRFTGAIAAAAIPVMVALGVQLAVQSKVRRYSAILAILAGAIVIPLSLVTLLAFACMAGDCI